MLKLEHLRFYRRADRVHIRFADGRDAATDGIFRELLDAFDEARRSRWTRGELEEWCDSLARREKDQKLASGVAKLLLDRVEFTECGEELSELRRKLLLRSAAALKNSNGDYRTYRDAVRQDAGAVDIYADLPDFAKIENTDTPADVSEAVDAYNLALVQGVLLYTMKLRLELAAPRQEELRPLLRRMRFHRLLAKAEMPSPELTVLEIDGPFSLLESSRKYALQLALFFPAVVALSRWKLKAEVKINDRDLFLELSESSAPLRPPRRRADYLPPEITAFQNAFHAEDWELTTSPAFLPDGDTPIIPDFSFRRRSDGMVAHLELFHKWHKTGLVTRLADPEKLRSLHLILGVERSLGAVLDAAQEAETSGLAFRFRDFPGVETTLRALRKL